MKPEVALIVQAAIAGGVLAAAMAGLAMLVGQREVAGETLLLVPAGAVAGATATALMLSSWRRAGGEASGWPATRMASWTVLHLLWILPALVGVATFILQSSGWIDVGVDVSGIGTEAFIGLMLMIAAVGSAVVWGLPAYFMALAGCRRLLARPVPRTGATR